MKPPRGVQSQRIRYRPADLAREHGISAQAVRNYERDGLLPAAERTPSGYRVRDAELAHLLRRGGYLLADIALVLAQVREAGGPEALVDSLAAWRQRLTSRSRAMLTAASHLADYLQLQHQD